MDSSDDELMPKAFAVSGKLPPDSGPPTSGEEYLMRVKWEAQRCPDVVVSSIDPRQFDKNVSFSYSIPTIKPAPPGCKPSETWEKDFLLSFEKLHSDLEKAYYSPKKPIEPLPISLPQADDSKKWEEFCFGKKKNDKLVSPPCPPLLAIILRLEPIMVATLLEYHIEWLDQMTKERAQWLFALLSRLDKPLDPDIAASLRVLLAKTSSLRSELESADDPMLAPLNIIITIVSKFFQQGEND